MPKSSTSKSSSAKPGKPYPDFPLFPHATGRWAKKIKGKFHYFGKWNDPEGALQKYLDQRDELYAGRTPRVPTDSLTIRDLVNRFLTAKQARVDSGELAPRTFQEYHNACARVIETFGKDRPVSDLASIDFERLRNIMAKNWALETLKVGIKRVKILFKYGYDAGLLDKPIRYGSAFDPPSKRVLLKAKQQNGPKMFEAVEIRAMLDAASIPLTAMILLGINCGFGNNDVATLQKSALDLERGWVNHPRPKTGVDRRCPLWPETVTAIQDAIAKRQKPKDLADDRLVFITSKGNPWTGWRGKGWQDAVAIMSIELLKKLNLRQPGRNFYALRHTFETIGGESIDQVGVDFIMGHVTPGMGTTYRQRISDDRLQAVVDHVHKWLFGDASIH